jgi:hypothetical protein
MVSPGSRRGLPVVSVWYRVVSRWSRLVSVGLAVVSLGLAVVSRGLAVVSFGLACSRCGLVVASLSRGPCWRFLLGSTGGAGAHAGSWAGWDGEMWARGPSFVYFAHWHGESG